MAETAAAAATTTRQAQAPQLQGAIARLEVVTFKLGEEEYGIDIQKVQELRGYDAVTRIANAPEYIKG
ncbi:chemotaxis protein CheW, partial [uncultured Variovorax sp.]|uniref:chemotaxis protein CheW n=1 Tax=uncultured Variovorax sp. TaxID=114708 RepID=UPI0025E8589B